MKNFGEARHSDAQHRTGAAFLFPQVRERYLQWVGESNPCIGYSTLDVCVFLQIALSDKSVVLNNSYGDFPL